MRLPTLLAAAAILGFSPFLAGVSCGLTDLDVREATIAGEFSGAQVVPPVETGASGRVTARVYGDVVSIRGTFSGLEGVLLADEEGAAVFRIGARGENGAAIAVLDAASADGRSGSIRGDLRLETSIVDALIDGGTYVELRTDAHPEGEVRAQIE